MKRTLWLLGVAVAALTSCTQSEVVDIPESRVIGFDTFVGKDSRTVGHSVNYIETSTLNNFWVYCAKGTVTEGSFSEKDANEGVDGTQHFFDAVEVQKHGTNYTYAHKHWEGGKEYRFGAYSNGNVVLTTPPNFISKYTDGKWGFIFSDYTAADKDLIVALPSQISVNAEVTNTTHVNLAFNHMLARVQFVFYTTVASGTKLKIHPFYFEGLKTATCTVMTDGASVVLNPTWTDSGTSGSYEYGTEGDDLIVGTKVVYEHYVIPQNNQTLFIPEIKIQTLNSDNEVVHTQTFANVSLKLTDDNHKSWKAGNIYSYQATVGSDSHEIHFKATVESWDDPTGGDTNITPTTPSSNS